MSQKIITTLRPENNTEDELYPNILVDNIPSHSIGSDKLTAEYNDNLNNKFSDINTNINNIVTGVVKVEKSHYADNYSTTGTIGVDIGSLEDEMSAVLSGTMTVGKAKDYADGGTIDSNKQNTLVSGTNIKTINNISILGSGNIDLTSADTNIIGIDNLLGAYDTISGNTITRQTGYLKLDGSQNGWSTNANNGIIFILQNTMGMLPVGSNGTVVALVSDKLTPKSADYVWNNNTPFIVSLNTGNEIHFRFPSDITSISLLNSYLSANPIYIQYKLATSYTDNKYNYSQQLVRKDSQEFLVEEFNKSSNEWGGSSLNLYEHTENGATSSWNGNVCTVHSTTSNDPYVSIFGILLKSGTYTISFNRSSVPINASYIHILNSESSPNAYLVFTSATKYTFTISKDSVVELRSGGDPSKDIVYSDIMINTGSHVLPYSKYQGAVVHTSLVDYIMQNIPVTKSGTLVGIISGTSTLPYAVTVTETINTGLNSSDITVTGINCTVITKNYNSTTGELSCLLTSNDNTVLRASYSYNISLYREYYNI